jgi:general secretion pathway protein G
MRTRPARTVRRAAFTLVEMMVVVVIIGLLATVVVPNVFAYFARAVTAKVKVDIVAIDAALQQYALNNAGHYPDDLVPLVTPDTNGMTYLNMEVVPKDPWGVEYQYEAPIPGHPMPRVFTLGKDMRLGGNGDDMDIDSQMIRNSLIK